MQQLLVWMWWQVAKSCKNREVSKKDPFKTLQVLTKMPKGKHNLTEEQVFSKLFYNEKIKTSFDSECAQQGVESENKKERMEILWKVTSEAWKEASQDEEVYRQVLEEKARRVLMTD
ncbi:hypothetical protein PAXRUDRAFT_781916 [Paxillus rubicundulus Ve08.2h10]|uniref:Uncharacterized protein n=1 Tax=Paxillus rubicundulus Ve08.2h10 TaxID=930991 RepID=A0A0D0CYV8_9AGAM|nr:hypothetical protein PAXRUDRAFT_781916 [Paxillus rubicundulus Ve08.2h10]